MMQKVFIIFFNIYILKKNSIYIRYFSIKDNIYIRHTSIKKMVNINLPLIRKIIAYILTGNAIEKNTFKWGIQEYILALIIYGLFLVVSVILCRLFSLEIDIYVHRVACVIELELLRFIVLTGSHETFIFVHSVLISYCFVEWFDYISPVAALLLFYFSIKAWFKYIDFFEEISTAIILQKI